MRKVDELYRKLIEYGIAAEDELNLVTDVAGYSEETLCSVVYARTGYQTFSQWLEDNEHLL